MSLQRKIDKALWNFWEYAHIASWHVLGDLPFTWDMKAKRNAAYFKYILHTDNKK